MKIFQYSNRQFSKRNVVIVGGKRTPVGTFMGQLSGFSAPHLGSLATSGALASCHVSPQDVEEVIIGNVISAGSGQAPARQVALGSGMKADTICTTINKVCASGMKSVMLSSLMISSGERNIMVAGGMESMSKVPHYMYLRRATGYGHTQMVDGIQYDGLTDVYNQVLMGQCSDKTSSELGISREAQDEYAINSYKKAREAAESGKFEWEIVDIIETDPKTKKEKKINKDDEFLKFVPEKFPQLKPAFSKSGTATAANSSKINDGACTFVLMDEQTAKERGLKPLARIIGYEDAAVQPIDFCIAPMKACTKLLTKMKMTNQNVDFFEFNEAFSSVPLANMKLLDLNPDKVNVHGGAVAIGHPIGMSGARIILSLINVLRSKNGSIGVAAICNGGGGASSIMIERLN